MVKVKAESHTSTRGCVPKLQRRCKKKSAVETEGKARLCRGAEKTK